MPDFKRTKVWDKVREAAQKGEIPFTEVSSQIPIVPGVTVAREKKVDPERRFAHYRTTTPSGKTQCYCVNKWCRKPLRVGDLLVCSEECRNVILDFCDKISGALRSDAAQVIISTHDFSVGTNILPNAESTLENDQRFVALRDRLERTERFRFSKGHLRGLRVRRPGGHGNQSQSGPDTP